MEQKFLTVMLADDEVTILEGLRKLLPWTEMGLKIVAEATDGMMAIILAKQHRPDIMIIDINMPLVSGLEALEVLHEALPETAFIVLSGYNEFEYARAALRFHVTEYLLKPVNFQELQVVLNGIRLEKIKNLQVSRHPEFCETDIPGTTIESILTYIHEHLAQELSLKQLAEVFHLNSSYISQLFKSEAGMNFYAYLSQLRINNAKVLLRTTGMQVAQIAQAVGFEDSRVFAKVFKKREGILPSQYRKNKNLIS